MRNRISPALGASLVGLCVVLAGCSARTDVSLTGNTPAQYSHVYVTTQEIWVNASATAGPDEGGWVKFPLSTPTTVDLVQQNGGNLGTAVTDLKILPGSYSQIRLIPVDASVELTSSAQTLGALYNSEADYVDSSGTTHQLPLELLNPDKGLGIQASLSVPIGNIGAALSGTENGLATNGTTTNGTSTTGVGIGVGSSAEGTTTPTTSSSTTSAPNNQFALNINGTTDLVQFSYGSPAATGVMLSSHAAAYDLSKVGGISGTLSLTNLTGSTGTSGLPAIVATAEVLSADGTRHIPVVSAPVNATGNFLLYPLNTSASNPAYYDVVIHGPGIATIIIKGVEVAIPSGSALTESSTSTTPTSTLGGTTTTGTTTTDTGTSTGTTSTTTTSSSSTCNANTLSTNGISICPSSSVTSNTTATTTTTTDGTQITINAVSLGTLYPRTATSYTANVTTAAGAALPAGTLVGFYQTLGSQGEVPYLIEAAAIDPFNQVLANPQSLSTATIDSGTWTSTSANVTVVSAAPVQGAGNYIVSATAPSFAGGALTTKITAPASSTTTPVVASLSALTLASGVSSGSIAVEVKDATPGKYNHGEVLVAQNGQLVATAPLDAALATGNGGTITLKGVPAQTSTALYYLSVRVWNSSDPGTTLLRQWYPTAVDLRSSSSGSLALTVN
jgi:Domain of unknown function (DUF4382)